jgi:hypothetical protein
MNAKKLLLVISIFLFSGCSVLAVLHFDDLYGQAVVRERQAPVESALAITYTNDIKPIIDSRCVVCHACYDAPCQLKLSSAEGIDRGASQELLYEGTRLVASKPTRLFEDAQKTQQWRDLGFHPVLNERDQVTSANLDAGLIARLLMQKEQHPLPTQPQLTGFDFSLNRAQQCPTIEEYDNYALDYPTWGMPYGMPNLAPDEYNKLLLWLKKGAIMSQHPQPTQPEQALVNRYEAFLNGGSLKHQISARYIYEHLFLSHLYFSELDGQKHFFQLIRSTTPPGEPVQRIASRRPYDDPKVPQVFYRIVPVLSTIVDKTHMPYALNHGRLKQWQAWFISANYPINKLPNYTADVAANPMTAFNDLPVKSRFSFMLDNAQNTIMAYIKGPVCRGQLALNVINDRFWVMFLDPDKADIPEVNAFYRSQRDNLRLPAEQQSNALPVSNWVKYASQQANYLEAKSEFTNKWFKDGRYLTTDLVWDGSGNNPNAALTVFRHFDSASVVQGLVGTKPKTAWIIDYELMERIHYLLVAGFDVYGNFGHQLVTRMFMDFMRLEGESNFITLLPLAMRHKEHSSWYRNKGPQLTDFMLRSVKPFNQPTQVHYKTNDPKSELFDQLKQRLSPILSDRYEIKNTGLSAANQATLESVNLIHGEGLLHVPQIMMLMTTSVSGKEQLYSILHNNAHTNISSLFDEKDNRDPKNDDLTIVRGVLGSYPSAYFNVKEADVAQFVEQLGSIKTEADYVTLLDHFGIRRSNSDFWAFSDKVHRWYQNDQPIEFGLLDYNRFENR